MFPPSNINSKFGETSLSNRALADSGGHTHIWRKDKRCPRVAQDLPKRMPTVAASHEDGEGSWTRIW